MRLHFSLALLSLTGCGSGSLPFPCSVRGDLGIDMDAQCVSTSADATSDGVNVPSIFSVTGHAQTDDGARFAHCTLDILGASAFDPGVYPLRGSPSDPIGSVHVWAAAGASSVGRPDYAGSAREGTLTIAETEQGGLTATVDALVPLLDDAGRPTAASAPLTCELPVML